MTSRLVDYIEAGKRLNPDEREIAALALQHVNETEQAEVDAAWDQEIDRSHRTDRQRRRRPRRC